jgi:hypothetical protein
MKRILFLALMVIAFSVPAFAQDAAAPAPAADAAAPAAEPVAEPAAETLATLEGQIVMKEADAFIKTADAEIALLPCEKLTELLKVEGLADKTFVLEGEKVPAKDGASEGFMIKNFSEKAAQPATEEVTE